MSKEVKAWKCEKCGKAWLIKDLADRCCEEKAPNKCRVCGCEVKAPFLICHECREKERFENAKKVKYSEYKIECLWDDAKDEYFSDMESLMERYDDDAYDDKEEPQYPEWCYGCIEIPFAIDIDSAIDRTEEEMYEEFDREKDVVDIKGLYQFIDEWNKKQTAKAYSVDYKTVILLNE